MSAFEEIQAKLQSASKGSRMMVLSESDVAKRGEFLPTPTYDLNRILSGSLYNGVVAKTHTVLVGPEASGKSSFMCINLAAAQKMGYTPVIIDAEGAWSEDFVSRWGVDPSKAIVINTPWIDEIMVELAKIIDNKWRKLALAIDSIGALEQLKLIDDGTSGDVKADQGGLQKKIKRMLKMIVDITKRQDSVSFSAGHYYGNPTGYGDPEKIGGGFYLKLSADYIVTLKKTHIYEFPNEKSKAKKGRVLGTQINAATLKNRIYPPFQEAVVEINYSTGVNKLAGIIKIATDMGLIEVAGPWFSCPILDMKVQGEANFYDKLSTLDPKPLLDEVEKQLKLTGYSTTNETLEQIVEDAPEESLQEETTEEPKKTSSRKKK